MLFDPPLPSRLYKETAPSEKSRKKKDKDKKKKKKKDKKKKKKRSKHQTEGGASTASSAEDEDPAAAGGVWSVVCLTLKDWEDLTERYSKSKKKCDRELHETLSESFLPEIVKMFAEKEREERRKLLMLQPKRASSRIERKKQEQEERDRVLAEKVRGQLSTAFPASLQCLKCFFCPIAGGGEAPGGGVRREGSDGAREAGGGGEGESQGGEETSKGTGKKREERKHPFVDGAKGIWRRQMIYPFTAS